jgi:hypothetical protein
LDIFTFQLAKATMSRHAQLALVIAICCLASGCRLVDNAWQTSIAEPMHYSRNVYEKFARRHFLGLAESALEQAKADARAELDDYDCEPFSVDYQSGFRDGFVDYLEAGGTGTPQPLPPRKYWKAKYQNPVGFQRMEDWVQGFQHGATMARASNYRSFVVVPVTDAVATDTVPYGYGRISRVNNGPQEDVRDDVRDDLHVENATSPDEESHSVKPPAVARLPRSVERDKR